uniref:Uncharacterized protein n=1 Tax=Aegilops tauschii TaxID=37682 RepID=R7W3R5_AEGTA
MATSSMLFLSFWVLGVGIAVAVRGNSTVCIAALRWPTLYVGIAFVVVSLFGCFCCCAAMRIGCCPKNFFLVGLFFVLSVVVVFSHVAVSSKYWGTISVCLGHRNTCDGMSLLTNSPVQLPWTKTAAGGATISERFASSVTRARQASWAE